MSETSKPNSPTTLPWNDYWTTSAIKQFAHYAEPQRRWSWSFLAKQPLEGNEKILVVGSTDGRLAADLSRFVPHGKVIGIDYSWRMIDWATKQYPTSDYSNLAFQCGGIPSVELSSEFDLITAFYILPFCSDPIQTLKEIKALLSPTGKAMLTVPAMGNPAFRNAMYRVKDTDKWRGNWNRSASRRDYSEEDYKKFFSEAGLKIETFERVETKDPFVDQEEFIGWLKTVIPPGPTTEEAKTEFCKDFIQEYISQRPEAFQSDGVYFGFFNRYEILARA